MQRLIKRTKSLTTYILNIWQKFRSPIEKKIEKQTKPVKYTIGSTIIFFWIINLINPFIPGRLIIIAGSWVIIKTRKAWKEKMTIILQSIILKTKDSLHKVKSIEFKQITSDKIHAISEFSRNQLTEIFHSENNVIIHSIS